MNIKLVAATLGLVAAVGTAAKAGPTISIGAQEAGVNGGAITTVATDGGSGFVNKQGTYGTFTFNSVSATGALLLQPSSDLLDSNSINVASTAGGVLTVYITEQGLSSPTAAGILSSFTTNALSGAISSVLEATYLSTTNALYDTTAADKLGSANFTASNSASSTQKATGGIVGPYSITEVYTITAAGAGNANSTIDIATVPEPVSLTLLGTGLVGLGLVRRRRPNRAA